MYKLSFEIGELPKAISPNARVHWAVRAKESRRWVSLVALMCSGRKPPKPLKRAKLTLTRFSSVAPDPDNLATSFKAILDGLVRCGVLENDKMVNIGFPEYRHVKVSPKHGGIRCEVEELTETINKDCVQKQSTNQNREA